MRHMPRIFNVRRGFTIIELLIVIVVIGILAIISVVGYSAVIAHAHQASIQQDLDGAADLLGASEVQGSTHSYPGTLAGVTALGVRTSGTATLVYNTDNTTNASAFCLEEDGWGFSYYITNTSHNGPTQGYCNGTLGTPSTSPRPALLAIAAGTEGVSGLPVPGSATSSKLYSPYGVASDQAGDIYIADTNNSVVEKVTPGGALSIFAGIVRSPGAPTAGPATSSHLYYPMGVAVDSSGNVYIADYYNNRVEKVTPSGTLSIFAGTGTAGTPTAGPATSSNLNQPYNIAIDSSGNVYIADYQNNMVEKVTSAGTLSIFAGTGVNGLSTAGPATSSMLSQPRGLAIDKSGNVYISNYGRMVVDKVTPSGTLSIFAGTGIAGKPTAGPATSSKLNGPAGMVFDSTGNLYLCDVGNEVVEEITPSATLSIFAGVVGSSGASVAGPALSSHFYYPFNIGIDGSGNIYVADEQNQVIEIIRPGATS